MNGDSTAVRKLDRHTQRMFAEYREKCRAKREERAEEPLGGPALEEIADHTYLRSIIRDPDAVYDDERHRRMREREQERFDPYAPDPPLRAPRKRVPLILEDEKGDRVAARPTEHTKIKKRRGAPKNAAPKRAIRKSAKVLRYAALNASLLHHPLAFRSGVPEWTESVFIGEQPYPSSFAIHALVVKRQEVVP